MPYATNNQISQSPIAGGIEITEQQYQEALGGMLDGKVVSIDGGFSVLFPPEPEEPEQPEMPEPDPVPYQVEGWQAEVAMRITRVDPDDDQSQTVWDRVQDLIAAMPDGVEKITIQTALARGKIRRDSAGLAHLAPLVPLSEQRVDDLLILADSIQA